MAKLTWSSREENQDEEYVTVTIYSQLFSSHSHAQLVTGYSFYLLSLTCLKQDQQR
jgi:hypothetical protein